MKKVLENTLIGTIGEDTVGLVLQRDLGFIWRPTPRLDVGYDGELEVRDSRTKEATGLIVKVQSKALQDFDSETNQGFVYNCSQSDLDYWLNSNVPDIIVISRSKTEELYWSPIKRYFELNPEHKKTKKILFDKLKNKLTIKSKEEITQLAVSKDKGLYDAPIPNDEKLYCNLMPVKWYPDKLFIAQTNIRNPKQIIAIFLEKVGSVPSNQWILKNKTIISFSDLSDPIWGNVCERGTVEEFDTSEWAESEDEDKRKEFVQLLNKNFQDKCWSLGLRFEREGGYYYFRKIDDQIERTLRYKGQSKTTDRQVITARYSKKDPSKIAYYRHFAFISRFVQIANKWYLEISPTYHMTRDGKIPDRFGSGRVSGMKKLQKNGNVLGEVIFVSRHLNQPLNLFDVTDNFVKFDELLTFEITGGIDETQWLAGEESKALTTSDIPTDEEDDFDGLPLLETV